MEYEENFSRQAKGPAQTLKAKRNRSKNDKDGNIKPFLRKTVPTNIVVSKYNTATGGVSTFR